VARENEYHSTPNEPLRSGPKKNSDWFEEREVETIARTESLKSLVLLYGLSGIEYFLKQPPHNIGTYYFHS